MNEQLHDPSTELAVCRQELAEAREQHEAVAEVLRIISRSPTELQPVLDAICERAARLCGVDDAVVHRVEGDTTRPVAHFGSLATQPADMPQAITAGSVNGRAMLERRTVHLPDFDAVPEEEYPVAAAVNGPVAVRARSLLAVPLLREEAAIGTFFLRHREPHAFSDKQIALLQTFADQAAIAIENARLFFELQDRNRDLSEALEQQTATAEVLRVIAGAPTDLQHVLDTILTTARRLVDVSRGELFLYDGEVLQPAAGVVPENLARFRAQSAQTPMRPQDGLVVEVAALERRTIHVPDVHADPRFASRYGANPPRPIRTALAVPLLQTGELRGVIFFYRMVVQPFTDEQIALVQTFADQAVIAIENARLFRELQEQLEQQTATSRILEVISGSPTELQPVLDAVVQSAVRLTGGNSASMHRCDGDTLTLIATTLPPDVEHSLPRTSPLRRSGMPSRAIADRRTIHLAGEPDEIAAEYPAAAAIWRQLGTRSALAVPLRREGEPIGVLTVNSRQALPFTERQIALLETFADQAVIAIENTRLYSELEESNATLREALEQQTAMAEVLRVIAGAPTDLQQVLDTILATAHRLVDVNNGGLFLYDGEVLQVAAGVDAESFAQLRAVFAQTPMRPQQGLVVEVAALERRTIHVPDTRADPRFAALYNAATGRNILRTALAVPLLRTGQLRGVIFFYRTVVQPFTDEQIALVQTFADQAVIAIENARLFTELQASNRELTGALERQTATGEVLEIISRSPTDLPAVLDTIVEHAARLVESDGAIISRLIDGRLYNVSGFDSAARQMAINGPGIDLTDRSFIITMAVRERRTVHQYGGPDALPPEMAELAEIWRASSTSSAVAVPLLTSTAVFGALLVRRASPAPLTPEQIAVVETFADQAVIAIENARLFEEVQTRTRELEERNTTLTEALEHQRATGEVLEVVSRSPSDLPAVLEAIGRSAMQLCQAENVSLFRVQDGQSIGAYRYNPGPDWEEGASRSVEAGSMISTAVLERRTVEFFGTPEDLARQFPRAPQYEGWTLEGRLSVPLLAGGEPLGAFVVRRSDRRFTPSEVTLIETFADQAVIAIENARLFEELQTRTRELEAASGAQREFLSRMSHELRTPLNAIIGFAEIMEMDPVTTLKQHERVGHILRGGRHLLGLINEVLDIARIEAGRLSLSLEPVALDAVLGEVLELMHPIAIDADVDLQVPDAPALHVAVQADKGRLRQIILNLVTNGVKYNHPGGSVTLTSVEGPDGLRRLTVSDTGSGITADEIDRLFAPFERLSADQSGVEGTGLGLAIAKRLAQAMGGDIGVESVVGQGCVFWLDLPAASLPLDVLSVPEDEMPLSGMNGAARAATVLYIEDNLPNVELVQHILGFRPGVTLLTAPRAEVGLRLAGRYLPDLILLDLNLPDLQGDEALARLRTDPRTAAIPVVMVSADATETQIQRLLAAGARDYLTKPLDVKRFLALLDEFVANDPQRSSEDPTTPRRARRRGRGGR